MLSLIHTLYLFFAHTYNTYKKSETIYKGFKKLPKNAQLQFKILGIKPSSLFFLSREEIKAFFEYFQNVNAILFQRASFSFKHIAPSSLYFIFMHLEEIQNWLASAKFKEKYLDTKHPYPPLLDCELLQTQNGGGALINESLSYVDIEAEIAWDLNLALPKGYKFTYITFGSSGSEAMVKFFNYCKVKTLFHWTLDKDKFAYYYRVLQDKNNFCALTLCCINEGIWAKSKLPYLIDEKVPLLFVTRDIIEMIRVIVNHTGQLHIDPLMKKFNLTCDYTKLFPKMNYAISNNEKPKIIIKNLVHRLAFQTKIKQWQHFIKEVICIDFNDIKPDKAFKTFKTLALKFGFESPKDEAIFKEKISVASSGRLATLPVVLYAHEDDLNNIFTKNAKNQSQNLQSLQKEGGISFIIGVYLQLKAKLQSGYIDISKEILDQKIIINDRELIVCIEKAEYEILKLNEKLMNASKAYIQGYIKALIENDKQIVSNLITCEQILEYLRENKAERKAVKQTLDQEYSYIKEHYSHFFKSWKYYNEFEKMCEELDKKD